MIKPRWLKVRPPTGVKFQALQKALQDHGLNTVCQGANCPNIGECWSWGTATFMIMGSICTRSCRFCAVKKGRIGEPLDPSEPERIAAAVEKIELKHVILTSVDRDDLIDGGAGHFANCIRALKGLKRIISIEALIPDFQGDIRSLEKIVKVGPDIIAHNIETAEEFQALVRDRRAGYSLSLEVLKHIKQMSASIYTKSSLMLGLGETEEMIVRTMHDLKNAGVDIITLGQYLTPTKYHLEVKEYLSPENFAYYKRKAEDLGFLLVVSGPLVRSSYMPFASDTSTTTTISKT
jgi:lipoic acid synthetase